MTKYENILYWGSAVIAEIETANEIAREIPEPKGRLLLV
jgi:hypothetical protein